MKVEGSLCSSIPNQDSSTKSQERCSVTIERRKLPQKVHSPTTMMKTAKPGQNSFSIVCKRFEAPFYRQHPWLSPLYMFFPNHPLLTTFFWQYCPNDIQVKHKNKLMREKYFLWLEDYKRTSNYFFMYMQHFHMPHQAKIWFEIITVSCIKRI